jgi:hypothetical protein
MKYDSISSQAITALMIFNPEHFFYFSICNQIDKYNWAIVAGSCLKWHNPCFYGSDTSVL